MTYYPSRDDKELREIAMGIADNQIFTNLHLQDMSLLPMVFMPIALGGLAPLPVTAKCLDDTGCENVAKDGVYPIVKMEDNDHKDMIQLKIEAGDEWFMKERFEVNYCSEHLEDIGMIFEWYDKAGPRSINGCPCFFSMHILNKVDTDKVQSMAEPLVEMKRQFVEEGKVDE